MKKRTRIKKAICLFLAATFIALMFFQTGLKAEAASGKWMHNSTGWWYKFSDGSYAKNQWLTIGGKKYYFGSNGYMKTGTVTINGTKYTFDSNGALKSSSSNTGSSGIKVPSTKGWTSKKKIKILSYDSTMKTRVDMILKKYPQLKPYVQYLDADAPASSGEYLTSVFDSLDSKDHYPSIVVAENSTVSLLAEHGGFANLRTLGLTQKMTKNMYPYTIKQGTYKGKLVAVSGQTCPGVVFYNKKIAKKVFGTDNPTAIQKKLKDWNTFYESGKALKKKGYSLVASADEVEEAFLYGKNNAWVKSSGKTRTVTIDASIKNYAKYLIKLSESGFAKNTSKWSSMWSEGIKNNKVFCYFGSPWMTTVVSMYGAKNGEWGVCQGPAKFNWGGDYLMAGKKTPNKELTKFMLAELTCDTALAVKFANAEGSLTNNKVANARLANGSATKANPIKKFFKGQNAYKIYANAVKGMKSYLTYDDTTVLSCVKTVSNGYIYGEYESKFLMDDIKLRIEDDTGWKTK